MKKIASVILLLSITMAALSQVPKRKFKPPSDNEESLKSFSNENVINQVGKSDTASKNETLGFEHRNDAKDSFTLSYKYLDQSKKYTIDSSINDFDKYFSVPTSFQYLGNNGSAATALIFNPFIKPGFDPGFHAFDVYKFTLENSAFYKTTKPFSSMSYQLASGKEQMLKAFLTENLKPNLNIGLDYRLISAPGFFINQNNNDKNYRLFSNYQGKRKRYNLYALIVGNNIRASENGGIQNDSFLLDPNRKDRFSVPVNLGNNAAFRNNPFVTTILTGNQYKDFNFFLRQSYDLGNNDSIIINDTTKEYLFYPRVRFQHSFKYSSDNYNFVDIYADSLIYSSWYHQTLRKATDTFNIEEKWKRIENEFSIYQFPDKKNQQQFFAAGATIQNITRESEKNQLRFYNVMLSASYNNLTRNKLWNLSAKGTFYLQGLNQGDYEVAASINRHVNNRVGDVNVFFKNVNRSQSFIFDNRSFFNLSNINSLKKENVTVIGGEIKGPIVNIGFKNFVLSNYTYFKNYFESAQSASLINLAQLSISKKIKFTKNLAWYVDANFQYIDGASPIHVPFFYSRQRVAFEGLFYKNLNLCTGLEARYYTGYKADNYSPLNGQFFLQNNQTIKNSPDIAAFLNFRIKAFTGFLRAENLNTLNFNDGFSFTNNNFAAPQYPTQGLMIRFGTQWWFVN